MASLPCSRLATGLLPASSGGGTVEERTGFWRRRRLGFRPPNCPRESDAGSMDPFFCKIRFYSLPNWLCEIHDLHGWFYNCLPKLRLSRPPWKMFVSEKDDIQIKKTHIQLPSAYVRSHFQRSNTIQIKSISPHKQGSTRFNIYIAGSTFHADRKNK